MPPLFVTCIRMSIVLTEPNDFTMVTVFSAALEVSSLFDTPVVTLLTEPEPRPGPPRSAAASIVPAHPRAGSIARLLPTSIAIKTTA